MSTAPLPKIDKRVPLPAPRPQRERKYPLREMKVGDSFLIPTPSAKNLAQSVRNCAKGYGFKVAMRTVAGGVRFWRVK